MASEDFAFIDQSALYTTFDASKPWDHAANQAPSKTVVPVYSKTPDATTLIRLPKCKGSAWDSDEPLKFSQIIDGTSNTIAVIIAPKSAAVAWSKPGYLQLDEQDLLGSVFGDKDQVIVGFFDGSVQVFTKAEMTEEKLRAMLTIAGREVVKR